MLTMATLATIVEQDEHTDTAEERQPTQFMDLPVELRQMVYGHAMQMNWHLKRKLIRTFHPRVIRGRYNLAFKLPSICYINKLEQAVVTRVLLHTAGLTLSLENCAPILIKWLNSIAITGCRGFEAITKVELDFLGDRPDFANRMTKHMTLLRKFPALRKVVVTVLCHDLMCRDGRRKRPLTTIEAMAKFDLDLLVECTTLKRLTFNILQLYVGMHAPDCNLTYMDVWAQRFKDVYEEKNGRSLEVDLVCHGSSRFPIKAPVGGHVMRQPDWIEQSREHGDELSLEFRRI